MTRPPPAPRVYFATSASRACIALAPPPGTTPRHAAPAAGRGRESPTAPHPRAAATAGAPRSHDPKVRLPAGPAGCRYPFSPLIAQKHTPSPGDRGPGPCGTATGPGVPHTPHARTRRSRPAPRRSRGPATGGRGPNRRRGRAQRPALLPCPLLRRRRVSPPPPPPPPSIGCAPLPCPAPRRLPPRARAWHAALRRLQCRATAHCGAPSWPPWRHGLARPHARPRCMDCPQPPLRTCGRPCAACAGQPPIGVYTCRCSPPRGSPSRHRLGSRPAPPARIGPGPPLAAAPSAPCPWRRRRLGRRRPLDQGRSRSRLPAQAYPLPCQS
jgi:hypothetical protein